MSRKGLTQAEIMNQQNIMLIDTHWPDPDRDYVWNEEEEFEDDDIDEW